MKKKFITIVPHIENIELRKDTGQIPYHFSKQYNYESILISYFFDLENGRKYGPWTIVTQDSDLIEKNYPFLNTETPGLKMFFLNVLGRGRFYDKAILNYLRLNSSEIDILNLFHLSSENIFYTLYFKIKNPKGKVYIKLDLDIDFYKSKKHIINIGKNIFVIGKLIEKSILYFFFRKVDLLSAESSETIRYFKNRFNPPAKKLIQLPNGVDHDRILSLIDRPQLDQKENILITVGRIGNIQKNTEFLLNAISNTDLKDWKVYLVGPIEDGFQKHIDLFFNESPHLLEKIIFTGAIKEPIELYKLYSKAKIFCLPSKWEGFPLVLTEAIFFGCYILYSSNIYAAKDICVNKDIGTAFNLEETSDLPAILTSIIKDDSFFDKKFEKIVAQSSDFFTWQNIIKKLKILTD